MLHEILLSLAGYPSPLLRAAVDGGHDGTADSRINRIITPPERALLEPVARLSDLHANLITFTAQIGSSHFSAICRAVANAIDSIHLAEFRQKVVEVESTILRKDAALVGAYNIVPLTAFVAEFSGWNRRMEWLWELVQFMAEPTHTEKGREATDCTGSALINRLRGELQTGYMDIQDTARILVRVAEMAWLRQVSTWILYGRLPSFGSDDFFIQKSTDDDEEFASVTALLPSFVNQEMASSMLFIGRSLNHIRARSAEDRALYGADHLSSQLTELKQLTYPLESASFSRTIISIREHLSRTTLLKLLPVAKVIEALQLLREFFLLGRGEFAMTLTQQADERVRRRWKRADNLAYEKRDGLSTVTVKEGEVCAVLERTWAAMGSMQRQHAEEDEGLERARDVVRLTLAKSQSLTPKTPAAKESGLLSISPTPFRNLLFSVPVIMTMQIHSPLDLFLSQSDLETYTLVNSYLLSIRRAHIRLTDLWKIPSLRRHHPAPPGAVYGSTQGGRQKTRQMRERHTSRSNALRNAWATASAAIFFLAETEAYLQTEVVAGLWDGLHEWLVTGGAEQRRPYTSKSKNATPEVPASTEDEDDIWLAESTSSKLGIGDSPGSQKLKGTTPPREERGTVTLHDPQTLAVAHRLYLRTLVRRLLLTEKRFTDSLYELLVHIDQLVGLVHQLDSIWTAADLEADAGVIDAFVDLDQEDHDLRGDLRTVAENVKRGVQSMITELRSLEGGKTPTLMAEVDGANDVLVEDDTVIAEPGQYTPTRVGGVDHLLMKLDFGTWFGPANEKDVPDERY